MSAIFRSLSIRRSSQLFGASPRVGVVQRAGFHQCGARLAGKETELHTDGRADRVEEAKQDILKRQKDGTGYWHEEVASDSESIIKAERGDSAESTEESIKKLHKEAEVVSKKEQKTQKGGTSFNKPAGGS